MGRGVGGWVGTRQEQRSEFRENAQWHQGLSRRRQGGVRSRQAYGTPRTKARLESATDRDNMSARCDAPRTCTAARVKLLFPSSSWTTVVRASTQWCPRTPPCCSQWHLCDSSRGAGSGTARYRRVGRGG